MAAEADASVGKAAPAVTSSRTTVFQWLRSHAVRRLSWGVADQIVSSLTNFAVAIYIVHSLGAVQFGAFSLAYVTYGFALNASRGLATDPLMVRFSGIALPTWRRAVTSCTGTAAVTGLVIGAFVLAVAAVLSGTVRAAFLALGLTLPALMLQDSWRYSFFAHGRGVHSFLNDLIWALTLLPALVLLRKTGHGDVFWFVFAWGATAGIAAAAGLFQARVIPRLGGAWGWMSDHRDLGPRYLAEGVSNSASGQLRAYGVGLILGLATLGSVQAAATLFGPMTILFLGMSLVAIPEGARILRRSPRHLPLFCLLVSGALVAASVACGIALLVVVPRGFGNWLLGPIWRTTYPLVLPQMFLVIGTGITFGVGVGLHALGAARRSLRSAVLTAVLFVIGSVAGAATRGNRPGGVGRRGFGMDQRGLGWWQLGVAQRGEQGHRFQLIRPDWRRRELDPGRRAMAQSQVPRAALATAGVVLLALIAATGSTLAHDLSRPTGRRARARPESPRRQAQAGASGGVPVIARGRRGRCSSRVEASSFDPVRGGAARTQQAAASAIGAMPPTSSASGIVRRRGLRKTCRPGQGPAP